MRVSSLILILVCFISCDRSSDHSELDGFWVLTTELTNNDSILLLNNFKLLSDSNGVINYYNLNKRTHELVEQPTDPYHLTKFLISDSSNSLYPKIIIGSDHSFYKQITYLMKLSDDTLELTSIRGTEKYVKYNE